MFVKISGEPKPVFLDFRSYFLVEAFEALFTGEKEAVMTEMLPDVDQLWLTDHQNRAVTAELRIGCGRAATQPLPAGVSSQHSNCALAGATPRDTAGFSSSYLSDSNQPSFNKEQGASR